MTAKNAPSTKFTRDELRDFAAAGVRDKVRDMERTIVRLQREFPDVLIEGTIALLKPEARTDGQSWPQLPPPTTKKTKRSWTPAQRKAASARMRKMQPLLRRAKKLKKGGSTRSKRSKKGGVFAWQKMQAALAAAPDQKATTKDIQSAAGLTSVQVANSLQYHPEIFKRVASGVYALTAAGKKTDANGTQPE